MAKTYNDVYIAARRTLRDAGVEAYGMEARLIVSRAADKTVAQFLRDLPLYAVAGFDETVEAMVERRLAGEPVAYITGGWEFYGVPLDITPDVLIPRPETELMVEAAIRLFEGRNGRPRILDLCAGSGCVGCAMAVHMPGAKVVMVDNDRRALSVCRKNVQKNRLDTRVMCIEADATGKPPMLLGKFDLLACNAPYVPSGEIPLLDASVRKFEPWQALDGGADGLDFYRRIIAQAPDHLVIGGRLMLEIGYDQAGAVAGLLRDKGYYGIEIIRDYGGNDRIATAVRSMRQDR